MIKRKNNYSDFFSEVKTFENLLKNSRWARDIRFLLEIGNASREMLLQNRAGKIKKIWRWEEGEDNKTIFRLSDRKRFEEKMDQLEHDALLGKEIREGISRGEIEIFEKGTRKRKI